MIGSGLEVEMTLTRRKPDEPAAPERAAHDRLDEALDRVYCRARLQAARETKLSLSAFPDHRPYNFDDVFHRPYPIDPD